MISQESAHSYCIKYLSKQKVKRKVIDNFILEDFYFRNYIYIETSKREIVDILITRKNKDIWLRSLSNEWGRLAQGNNLGVKGTNTIDFIF